MLAVRERRAISWREERIASLTSIFDGFQIRMNFLLSSRAVAVPPTPTLIAVISRELLLTPSNPTWLSTHAHRHVTQMDATCICVSRRLSEKSCFIWCFWSAIACTVHRETSLISAAIFAEFFDKFKGLAYLDFIEITLHELQLRHNCGVAAFLALLSLTSVAAIFGCCLWGNDSLRSACNNLETLHYLSLLMSCSQLS